MIKKLNNDYNVYIGFTTINNLHQAKLISKLLIKKKLSFCIQIDSPIFSIYKYNNIINENKEYRISIKFLKKHMKSIEIFLKNYHTYKIPELIILKINYISNKYYNWINIIH